MKLKNFAVTAKAESVAQVPKTPWVAPEGSFTGYEDEWDRAVNENVSRLEYVQQYSEQGQALPPPVRQKPAGWVEIEKSADMEPTLIYCTPNELRILRNLHWLQGFLGGSGFATAIYMLVRYFYG